MIKNVIQASSFKVGEATCDLQLISDGRKEMNKIEKNCRENWCNVVAF